MLEKQAKKKFFLRAILSIEGAGKIGKEHMPEIEVNIEIYCAGCGAGLCSNATATKVRHQPCFQVEPCSRCLDKADTEGYQRALGEE